MKILSIPCISLILVGTFFSGAVSLALSTYMMTFINLRGYNVETYSNVSGALMFFGGLFGNIFYAKLCDKLEHKIPRIKSYSSSFQNILCAAVMFSLFFFSKLEFWSVMTLIAIFAFFCKGFRAPNLSMINNCAP